MRLRCSCIRQNAGFQVEQPKTCQCAKMCRTPVHLFSPTRWWTGDNDPAMWWMAVTPSDISCWKNSYLVVHEVCCAPACCLQGQSSPDIWSWTAIPSKDLSGTGSGGASAIEPIKQALSCSCSLCTACLDERDMTKAGQPFARAGSLMDCTYICQILQLHKACAANL